MASLTGRVVRVNFWGHWCGPCVAEMPRLMHVWDKCHDRGLAVVSVHVDDNGEVPTVAALAAKTARYRAGLWHGRDLPFPTALLTADHDRHPLTQRYGVRVYPTLVVVGRDGRLVGAAGDRVNLDLNADEATVDAAVERLLAAQ